MSSEAIGKANIDDNWVHADLGLDSRGAKITADISIERNIAGIEVEQ